MNIPTAIIEIAEHYGLESRKNQLMEEMGELTQAICKEKRTRGFGEPTNKTPQEIEDSIVEELADVYIVVLEMIHLLGVKKVMGMVAKKIKRTKERMKKTRDVYKNDTKRNNGTKECDCLLP